MMLAGRISRADKDFSDGAAPGSSLSLSLSLSLVCAGKFRTFGARNCRWDMKIEIAGKKHALLGKIQIRR